MSSKDKKDPFLSNVFKDGVTVEEMQNFARKYMTEIFIIIAIIIAAISSAFDFFTGPSSSLMFAAIGAILSIGLPSKVQSWLRKIFQFIFNQEKITQIIINVVRIVIAIFLPLITFLELGLLAGVAFHSFFKESAKKSENEEL